MHPSANTVEGTYGPEGGETVPLGQPFGFPSIGSAEVPSLQTSADRFGMLAERSGPTSIRLGATVARFSSDERVLPLQLSYGVFDRLTVGVTVPIIRKRLETILRIDPTGADVGRSPGQTGASSVFLTDADASIVAVQSAVDGACMQLGEEHAECLAGRGLLTDAGSFLSELEGTYQDEALFPLEGSTLGEEISARWNTLVGRFQTWDVVGPGSLPLATDGINQATFKSLVVDPAWPGDGFPLERTDALFSLGDVEVNVAIGLLQPDAPTGPPGAETDPGLQLYLAAIGTARFATGSPDSLRTVSPIDPPRGVSGFSLGGVADLLLPGALRRFAILSMIETGWNGTRDIPLLVPDATLTFTPGRTRTDLRWSPGSHIRASVIPRFRVGESISFGLGWHLLRREPDSFDPVEGALAISPPQTNSYTQHRIGVELRYTSMHPPALAAVPFPFEVLFRGSWSAAGSEGAPVESRAEAMVRFRLRE